MRCVPIAFGVAWLGLGASGVAWATPTDPVCVSRPEGAWRYAVMHKDGPASYAPQPGDWDDAAPYTTAACPTEYRTYSTDAGAPTPYFYYEGWAGSRPGTYDDVQYTLHTFTTWVRAAEDTDLWIRVAGDDGHAATVDGVMPVAQIVADPYNPNQYVMGPATSGFGQIVVFPLHLPAGQPVEVTLVGHNSGGPAVWILGAYDAPAPARDYLAAPTTLEDWPGLEVNADGAFAPAADLEVALTAGPATLWPPDHRRRSVVVAVTVTGGDPDDVACFAQSDQPDNTTGDGAARGDVDGHDGYAQDRPFDLAWNVTTGTFEGTIALRAERAATLGARTYALSCTVVGAGDEASAQATVTVPLSMGAKPTR